LSRCNNGATTGRADPSRSKVYLLLGKWPLPSNQRRVVNYNYLDGVAD